MEMIYLKNTALDYSETACKKRLEDWLQTHDLPEQPLTEFGYLLRAAFEQAFQEGILWTLNNPDMPTVSDDKVYSD